MKAATAVDKARLGSRRSQRLKLQVPIMVSRPARNNNRQPETTLTLSVNAWGALLTLKMMVHRGEVLSLKNVLTMEELECRVVYVGPTTAGGQKIGVEFTKASLNFWQIYFPPLDARAAKAS